MTQKQRNLATKQMLGRRLGELVDSHLMMSWESLAEKLGYATSSTLRQARDGETLMSVEKLTKLASITTDNGGKRVSVDWLLTGSGPPLLELGKNDAARLGKGCRESASIANRVANAPLAIQRKIAVFLEVHGQG